MSELLHVAPHLRLDLEHERWLCDCGQALGPARESVKRGLLVHERDPREIHPPLIEGTYTFAPDPDWVRILEFYCPGCGAQLETEYLPPGHPVTHTTEIDIDRLKQRLAAGEVAIRDGHLVALDPGPEPP